MDAQGGLLLCCLHATKSSFITPNNNEDVYIFPLYILILIPPLFFVLKVLSAFYICCMCSSAHQT